MEITGHSRGKHGSVGTGQSYVCHCRRQGQAVKQGLESWPLMESLWKEASRQNHRRVCNTMRRSSGSLLQGHIAYRQTDPSGQDRTPARSENTKNYHKKRKLKLA